MFRVSAVLALILSGIAHLAHGAWGTSFWGGPALEIFRQPQTGNSSIVYNATARPDGGPIWFGTDDGLMSFDGRNWRNFADAQMVVSLALESDGRRLWYGGWCDVGWFDVSPDGRPRRVSLREKLPFAASELRAVRACHVTRTGTYFVADDRVLRWDGAKFAVWHYATTHRLYAIAFEDALWFQHLESGLHRLGDRGPERVATSAETGPFALFGLERINGELVGASNRGFWTIGREPRGLSSAALNAFLEKYRLVSVAPLRNNYRIVTSLTGGMVIVDPSFNIVRQVGATDGLSGTLFGQFLGRDHDLWLLCEDRVMRLDVRGATSQVRLDDDARPKFIRTLATAPDQSVWVGAQNHLFHVTRDEHGAVGVKEITDAPLRELQTLSAEGNRVWIGGFGTIALLEGDRTTHRFAIPSRPILHIARLGTADRWIAALADGWFEFSRSDSGEWHSVIHAKQPVFNSLTQDSAGQLWSASSLSGPQKWTRTATGFAPAEVPEFFGSKEAAPSTVVGRRRDIVALAGTKAYLIRSGETPVPLVDLPGTAAACTLSADEKRLYVAFRRGPNAPPGYQDGVGVLEFEPDATRARWRSFLVPDLPSLGTINKLTTTFADGSDTLWIGGSDGLLQTRPDELAEWRAPATPQLTLVAPESSSTTVSYSESVQLRVASPEITLRPALRYQTQFGQDSGNWSAPGERTSFEFSNLREGRYLFAVRAVNPAGQTSAPAYFNFTVLPPWYRSGWAYAGYTLLAGFSLLAALRYRERRLRTRTQELERLVRERTVELEKANAAKDEFLASMSHEIRNPMNGVVGLSAAIDISFLDEEGQYRFGLLRHCASHLTSLLEDILDFSKLQSGTIELDPQPFSPTELLEAVSAITSPVSAAAGVRVDFALGPTVPPRLIGDARRIRQVLLNYVGNAVKYAPQGTIEVTAWARAGAADRVALTFAVSDEGPGIPAAEHARIFEKFERGAGARSSHIPGTGMGLAVCRRLAEKMGGRAWVESAPGQGSTFYLELDLPLAPAVPAVTPARAALDALPKRALVVDDEEYNVVSLGALLERRGFSVQRALDATTALREAAGHQPDIIFLDYDMPDSTGPQLARRIRETLAPLGRFPLVLATTAYTTVEKRAECLAAGMDGFLGKPVVEERLQTAIEEAIRSRNPAGAQHMAVPDPKHFDPLENLHTLARQHARTLESELAEFATEAEAEFAALIAAIAEGDAEHSARAAHKLSGRFGFLHAAAPMRRGLQLEQLCRAKEWSTARPLAEELAQDWTTLRESLARLTCASAE